MPRLLIIFALLWSLWACDQANQDAPDPQSANSTVAVTVQDELGGFSSPIEGVAFWEHPRHAFNGLMLVATQEAVMAYNIETGENAATISDVAPQGLALSYQGLGQTAKGVITFYDRTLSAFKFYEVDNDTGALYLRPTLFVMNEQPEQYCFGRARDGNHLTLQIIANEQLESYTLSLSDAGVIAEQTSTAPLPATVTHCAIDDLDGAVYTATSDGSIHRFANGRFGTAPFANAPIEQLAGIGVVLQGLVEDGNAQACCGYLILLDGKTGAMHLLDREDGHAAGSVQLTSSFDVEAVSHADHLGLAYGNYGGALRSGVVAAAINQEQPVVRFVPLAGVINALSLPAGKPGSPRFQDTSDEDDLTINFEPPTP